MNVNHADTNTELEILPAAQPMSTDATAQLMVHAQNMQAAKQLGDALAGTDMVPADYKGKPGNAAAAILFGAELGLNPIQSLQQIFVVHGKPAIYARTAVALVKRHGVVIETVASSDDSVTVAATRDGQTEETTWDMARATKAGYTANAKYKTNPAEMLWAKAAMEVCRRIAPDVLLGIPYAREELELETPPTRVSSRRGGGGVDALRALAAKDGATAEYTVQESEPAPEPAPDPEPAPEPADPPATGPQLKKLSVLRQQEHYNDDEQGRADWFAWVAANIGRDVASNKELTKTEASTLIEILGGGQ